MVIIKLLAAVASMFLACAALFLLVILVPCFTEERSIYIVLIHDGDTQSLAFHSDQQTNSLLHPNSKAYESHANRMITAHNQLLATTLTSNTYTKLQSFTHTANGFSIHTTPSQAAKLRRNPAIKLIEKDRGVKLMTTYSPDFLGLTKGVWSTRVHGGYPIKNAGEGIVIGVVDSGINPVHPSFSYVDDEKGNVSGFLGDGVCETGPMFPNGSCNGKIISARFFANGARAAAKLNGSVDFLSPFDAVGHGSHVASIAAGNFGVPVVVNGFYYGQASGMAPRARIAVYKAIYPTIGTLTDVVSAIDQAVKDRVDILTLSVGPDEPPEDTITFLNIFDIFMLLARRAGVFVVQAAGNHGPNPNSVVSFSPWAVGVGASSIGRSYPSKLVLGDGSNIAGVGLSGPTLGDGVFKYKLVLAKDAVKTDGDFPKTPAYIEECQSPEALDPLTVFNSIVICNFSTGFYNQSSTLDAIINTANTLGFMGFVLVANPAYGDFVAEPIPFSLPGIMIPKTGDANIVMQYYERNTQRNKQGMVVRYEGTAAICEGRVANFTGRAPIVSRFSSRGPDVIDNHGNPTDVLKPDFLAPGQQIWAAWSPISVLDPILEGSNFAILSGTSMAAPHVAGIAALIKQRNPSWNPSMVASALSTTATRYDNQGETIKAEGYDTDSLNATTPFDMGAGMVNTTRALDPGLVFTPGPGDYVNFLCSLPAADQKTVEASTGGSCDHTFKHPSDLNLPSVTISSLTGAQTVRRSATNVGGKQETYVCSVVQPEGVQVVLSPTYFTIGPDETQDLEINLNVTRAMDHFSFGEIVLTGGLDHIIRKWKHREN